MRKQKKHKIGVIGLKGLPAYGGAAMVGENIIANLSHKFDFTIYSISSHTSLKSGTFGNSFQIVLRKIPFKKVNSLFYYLRAALDAVLFRNFDLIHLHHRDATFIVPLLKLRYPTIVTTHGMVLTSKWIKYKPFFEFEDRNFMRYADYVTTVSLKDKDIVSKIIPENKIKYIPNGVNTNYRSNGSKKNYISFAAGRMLPDKGCHIFLEALDQLTNREQAIMIGDTRQNADYEKKLLQLQEQIGGVEFTGLIKDKNRLYELISASKFFVFPSTNESMSMMLLEVAALKVPIICSDLPENKDVFSQNEVLYFKVNDTNDLAEKISYASAHPQQMQEYANKAFQRLQTNYLWSSISKEYQNVFEKFLE